MNINQTIEPLIKHFFSFDPSFLIKMILALEQSTKYTLKEWQ